MPGYYAVKKILQEQLNGDFTFDLVEVANACHVDKETNDILINRWNMLQNDDVPTSDKLEILTEFITNFRDLHQEDCFCTGKELILFFQVFYKGKDNGVPLVLYDTTPKENIISIVNQLKGFVAESEMMNRIFDTSFNEEPPL